MLGEIEWRAMRRAARDANGADWPENQGIGLT
jgi:hypothetical protein